MYFHCSTWSPPNIWDLRTEKTLYIPCVVSCFLLRHPMFLTILLYAKLTHLAWHTAVVSPLKVLLSAHWLLRSSPTSFKGMWNGNAFMESWHSAGWVNLLSGTNIERFSKCCPYSGAPFLSYFIHLLLRCTGWAERLGVSFTSGASTCHAWSMHSWNYSFTGCVNGSLSQPKAAIWNLNRQTR